MSLPLITLLRPRKALSLTNQLTQPNPTELRTAVTASAATARRSRAPSLGPCLPACPPAAEAAAAAAAGAAVWA